MFEAAARAGSFTAAASEFNVSQPSISRAVAQLEEALGARLLDRQPRGLVLTRDGAELYTAVRDGFGLVGTAIANVQHRGRAAKPVITLSLSSSFVAHWLVPRLRDFSADFPQVDLRFDLISGVMGSVAENVDLATRIDPEDDTHFHRWPLVREIIVPVCSPAYLAARGKLDGDGDGHIFLHLTDHSTQQWSMLRQGRGRSARPGGIWHEFTDYAVILQAAINGEGIALGWVSVVSSLLVKGTLILAADCKVETGRRHSLLAPRAKPLTPIVSGAAKWIVRRMAQEMDQLAPVLEPLATLSR
jgi:LysR family transcriptional regulator, glycine cleavage system transcriptional activator